MLKWLSIASCIDRLYRYSKAPVEIFLASLGAPRSRHRIALCPAEVYHSAGQGPQCGRRFGVRRRVGLFEPRCWALQRSFLAALNPGRG